MQLSRLDYQDWTILVSPIGSHWLYTCCPPEGEPLRHDCVCPDRDLAIAEAKSFIDRMSIRSDLSNLLDDWLELALISSHQYEAIDRLIARLMCIQTSHHLASAQTPQRPQRENLDDSAPEHPE